MSNALVPANLTIPAHILARQQVNAEINNEALNGMSIPQPPSIQLSGKQFIFVADGTETPHDQLVLAAVVLRAKKAVDKVYYLTQFTPGQDTQAPDCFSEDGIAPDPSSKLKQNDNCATCQHNQFNTSKNQDGSLGKGKACTDYKRLAIFAKGGVWRLRLPPASFKNFGSYVSALSARGIGLSDVVTKIGFDHTQTFAVLTFEMLQFIEERAVAVIDAARESYETLEIIKAKAPQLALPAPPVPPATPQAPPVNVVADLGLGLDMGEPAGPSAAEIAATAATKKASAAAAKAKKDAEAKASAEAAAAAARAAAETVAYTPPVSNQTIGEGPSIADLSASLGI